MPIAFGAAGSGGGGGTSPSTGSITVSGSETYGIAVFYAANNTNPNNMVLSSPTWNGVAMTVVSGPHSIWDGATTFTSWVCKIAGPTTGVVTGSISNAIVSYVLAAYYTGVDSVEASAHEEVSSTANTWNITTLTNNAWVVFANYATGDNMNNDTGTVRVSETANRRWLADNGPITPAGPTTMGASNQSGSYSILQIGVALAPPAVASQPGVFFGANF